MNNRLKRVIVLMSIGGMAFAFGPFGWGCQPFAENAPYVNFVEDIGDYAVETGVNNLFTTLGNPTLTSWFGGANGSVDNLYSSLWSGWVNYTYPQDPTYNSLLVN